jgi:hypothetical protein
MVIDYLIGDGQKLALVAIPTFCARFAADTRPPFVAACRRIAGFALDRFPPDRVHIGAAAK